MKRVINFSAFTCLIVWIFLLIIASQSIAAIYCVSDETNLIAALNDAKDNGADDVIQVQQGTYYGNFAYESTESFGLTIEGGYTSLCASRVVYAANTVLDGGQNGTVLALSTQSRAANFIVEGITLQNGKDNPAGGLSVHTHHGGVTLNDNTISNNSGSRGVIIGDASPAKLTNNTISNNSGIGLEFSESSANLTNNTISNNSEAGIYFSYSGGNLYGNKISNNSGIGIRGLLSYISLVNNTIVGNGDVAVASYLGGITLNKNVISNNSGGVVVGGSYGSGTFINNIISNNSGGGVSIAVDQGGTHNLINNTIINNSSDGNGGGINISTGEVAGYIANIYNNIIWNNNAVGSGEDLYIDNANIDDPPAISTVNLYNNDFDQSENGTYIQIPFTIDPSNLNNEDPLFVDPVNDDFHLSENSPCIDAGAGAIPVEQPSDRPHLFQAPPSFDIDGDSRPRDNGYDIGADEYPGPEYWTDDRMRNARPMPMPNP